ncbi:MAG: YdeI/OmpD-associated family protein, partial [Gammaproteobacteria bacterium]|nr:YdeI/OmpD-associated family protein [Gammaproteobacteria bacterium]
QYAGWLNSAKRPETRRKRLKEALERLRENRKPGMK